MIHSREFRSLCKKTIVFFVIYFIFSLAFGAAVTKWYENYLFQQEKLLVSKMVAEMPTSEEEYMQILQEEPIEINEALFENYGIDKNTFSMFVPSRFYFTVTGITLLPGIIAIVGIFLLYSLHLREIYRKIDGINTYINEILNDRYPLSMKEYEEGAFSTLKDDIFKITNKLREQSETLEKEKKYLETTLSDISHQLKTPLTSMNVINNLLEDDKLDKKVRMEFCHKNAAQLERIEWLVTSLLKLSRLESGTIQLKKEKVKVIELVEQALAPLEIPIELKNQKVVMDGKKNVEIIGDKNWTVEALVNIIKNAHEHTAENGTITISWSENPIYVELMIQDNGEGIYEEDLHHIFERFYKGSHNTKESIGIGLNMAYLIIHRQDGTIDVQSKRGEGTTFFIHFYKSRI